MSKHEAFIEAIAGIPRIDDPVLVKQKSRDRFAQSPVLREMLKGKVADVIVLPRDKDELVRVAAAAAKHRVPVTTRGGGTANFGQGVPLQGGALVDISSVAGVLSTKDAHMRALGGTRMSAIDEVTRPLGWELRIHPSTKRTASIGGFVAGGHGGIGSCTWGMLRDRGNITALEVMTLEETPRFLELRGADVNLVHHTYGTLGIITEVEMPLAPAWEWVEMVVCFPDFMDFARCAVELAMADGIVKKLISMTEWPLPRLFQPLAGHMRDGQSALLVMVAKTSLVPFEDLVAECHGTITSRADEGQGDYGVPLYEFTWGHALMHFQKTERARTAVMGLLPPGDLLTTLGRLHERFASIGPLRFEMERYSGLMSAQGSPSVLFESEAQLAQLAADLREEGLQVANPHSSSVSGVGVKRMSPEARALKQTVDPHGLLNPGRFDYGQDAPADLRAGADIQTTGWDIRQAG